MSMRRLLPENGADQQARPKFNLFPAMESVSAYAMANRGTVVLAVLYPLSMKAVWELPDGLRPRDLLVRAHGNAGQVRVNLLWSGTPTALPHPLHVQTSILDASLRDPPVAPAHGHVLDAAQQICMEGMRQAYTLLVASPNIVADIAGPGPNPNPRTLLALVLHKDAVWMSDALIDHILKTEAGAAEYRLYINTRRALDPLQELCVGVIQYLQEHKLEAVPNDIRFFIASAAFPPTLFQKGAGSHRIPDYEYLRAEHVTNTYEVLSEIKAGLPANALKARADAIGPDVWRDVARRAISAVVHKSLITRGSRDKSVRILPAFIHLHETASKKDVMYIRQRLQFDKEEEEEEEGGQLYRRRRILGRYMS